MVEASSAIIDAKNLEPHMFKEREAMAVPDPFLEEGTEVLTTRRTYQENQSFLEEGDWRVQSLVLWRT